MRNGDIGWLAVVVLAALAGAADIRAAAPPGKPTEVGDSVRAYVPVDLGPITLPVPESAGTKKLTIAPPVPEYAPVPETPPSKTFVKVDSSGPLNPLDVLHTNEWVPRLVAKKPGVNLTCPPGFINPSIREFTIVVRLEEQTRSYSEIKDALARRKWSLSPPSHALRRNSALTCGGQQDTKSVLDSLQQKLLELYEKEWFEIEFSPRNSDRTEMRIRYNPVYPTYDGDGSDSWPGGAINFFPGFSR
jgi:hypothetical protein